MHKEKNESGRMWIIHGTSGGKCSGLTLVEVMIVLVVLGILAAIALPAYQEHVRKARRAEGKAALMRIMLQQERYHAFHASYIAYDADTRDGAAAAFHWYSGETPAFSAYQIHAEACGDKHIRDCVQLVAQPGTPRVNSAYSDPSCGNLVMTSEGDRSAAAEHCW